MVGVPDGTNAENSGTDGKPDPGTPTEQVNNEITAAEVSSWWRSLFGMDQYQAGGGGTGGQFMFASLEELDGVIKKWTDERDGILADRDAIADAYHTVRDPAGDMMSRSQATASKDSLANMWHHSDSMLKYAENYIAKLNASRKQIAVTEDGAHARMRSIQV